MFIRVSRKISREMRSLIVKIKKIRFRFIEPPRGSAEWLIKKEIQYGGFVTNVTRNHVSPHDKRTVAELEFGGMTGGDRMYDNNYAPVYAYYLMSFNSLIVRVLAEFGTLKGTGLAIWCDLFEDGRIIGFDIDLGHFNRNKAELIRKGAFIHNTPEVCEFDQLVDGTPILKDILRGQTFDIVIDDGLHTLNAITTTFQAVAPYLSEYFVYFIEDYDSVSLADESVFNGYMVHTYGLMTVILPADVDIGQMR